jgi:GTPase SAR1 family protein
MEGRVLNVAVIGAAGVGKSSLINRLLLELNSPSVPSVHDRPAASYYSTRLPSPGRYKGIFRCFVILFA